MNEYAERLGRSPLLSPRTFQYACATSGVLCSLFFLFAFVAADFIPPTKPWWTAEQTVDFFKERKKRIEVGSALLVVSGMFYLPLTAAISAQMRRIPNLHYAVSALQLSSGAAGIFTFIMPGIILGVANFDLDRPAEITKMMVELFWITALMPWPTFMTQNFAFSFAVLTDNRPKPLFPKYIALLNVISPILFVPASAMHCTKTGPVAWNGALTFWVLGVVFCLQLFIDSACLFRAISNEPEGGEKIVDIFPTTNVPDAEAKHNGV
ncbi:uncharacterized protein B0J15DRAFT_571027 [Neofusicoccum parvum]|nr:uncharacterized protein B0J15DRAFT_571027 [Neofusicoccum parvum]